MTEQTQIEEILTEASAYGMRDSVKELAELFIVDNASITNEPYNIKSLTKLEAYEIAYNLTIDE